MRLGKSKQAILLAVLLFFSASAMGQAGKEFKFQFSGNLQKSDVLISNESITIYYSISELNLKSISNSHGNFYRISIPGHVSTTSAGLPELPVLSRIISLAAYKNYSIRISDIKSVKLSPSRKNIEGILYPAQEGETKIFQAERAEFKLDKKTYASKSLIITDTVRIQPLGTVRNKDLANLYISPVRYNPNSNQLEVITSMKIDIQFMDTDYSLSESLISESPLFNESLRKGVLNYNKAEVVPSYSEQAQKMVIITDTSFKKHLEPFIRWKTQKGFKLRVLYKGSGLAGNTYTELKDTLRKIYNSYSLSDPPPEYLLIIGDINKVPYYGSGNVTDMYYGEFDGDGDYIPEMYIGRLPVADTTELKSFISKLIQYEKFAFADTNLFYSHAIASAGYDAGYANTMNGQINYAINNYLTEENNISEHHFYYSSTMNLSANKDSIIKLINNGSSFVNYTGHGDAYGWLHLNIKTADTAKLLNKNMYPFIVSNACRTSQFNIANSFGNRMVLSPNKGAIGFIGCSHDSYWDEDYFWAVGTGLISADPSYETSGPGFYDRLFHTHNESPSDWYFTMGQINFAGNMAVSASSTSRKKYYWETYNLVGDPSVIPIIGKPDTYNIVLPDTLPNGIKAYSFELPPFSYVAVSHFDTLWDASYSSTSGSAFIDLPGISDDSCMIVITGQNLVPLIKTIYFGEVNDEYITLTETAINDSIDGNSNGVADHGETFSLALKVSNLGLSDANGVYAKISTESDLITINADSAYIGTLTAQSEILLPDELSISLSGEIPDMGIITINLLLKNDNGEKNYKIDICVHAPNLSILSCIMDDTILGNGNFIADPGETYSLIFKILNDGTSDIEGNLDVISQNDEMTVMDQNVKSGILKFGELTDIPVTVKLSESVPAGSYMTVSSTLDCAPYLINKNFTFRVGRIRESFEASSFNIFPWINTSLVPWTMAENTSADGNISARSGAITHRGTSALIIKTFYPEADSIKFFYKVSSEANYDTLVFRINGKRIFKKSGEVDWTKISVPVAAGLNTMEWVYYKDNSVSQGADCAWIDMIDFAGTGTVNYITKDLSLARIVSPLQKDQVGSEIVSLKVLNTGKDVINSFYLAYSINGGYPVRELFENTVIPFGDSVTVSFKTKANLSKYGIYDIIIYGYNNNDDFIFNDTLRVSIENTEISESLSVFPNPFSDHITVFINSKIQEKIIISLTNISGVKLYEEERTIDIGRNELLLTGLRAVPSVYYLNIRGSSVNKTIPVLKTNSK